MYFEVDSAPYAAGSSSFLGELLTQLGLGNIVPPALGPFPKLNPEFIVKAQPDLVMAVERIAYASGTSPATVTEPSPLPLPLAPFDRLPARARSSSDRQLRDLPPLPSFFFFFAFEFIY